MIELYYWFFHWTLTLFSLVIHSLQLPAEHEGGVPARPRGCPGVSRRHHQRPDHLAVWGRLEILCGSSHEVPTFILLWQHLNTVYRVNLAPGFFSFGLAQRQTILSQMGVKRDNGSKIEIRTIIAVDREYKKWKHFDVLLWLRWAVWSSSNADRFIVNLNDMIYEVSCVS